MKLQKAFNTLATTLACLSFVMDGAPASAQDAADAIVMTDRGAVRAIVEDGVELLLGIPYAAPPIGPLRWKPPQAAASWTGVRESRVGAVCPQRASIDSVRTEGEDCLFINVERPQGTSASSKLPVLVYIHGGGFYAGNGHNENPDKIVRETGIVAVTLNYRLGVLGFLALPSLTAESSGGGSGNYGFQDQQAALRWVRDNIATFGGDPRRVTVVGESAGGVSVCHHLVSPGSRGLFAQAIVLSGSCQSVSLQEAETSGTTLAESLLCTDAATAADCMRSRSVSAILDSLGTVNWPTYGTAIFPVNPDDELIRGNFAHVPVMFGATRDEGRGSQRLNQGWPKERYLTFLRAQFGAKANAVLARYPWPANPERTTSAYLTGAVWTDSGSQHGIGGCVTRSYLKRLSKFTTVYGYEFSPPATATAWYHIPDYQWGAGHATDLPYLFPKRNGGGNWKEFGEDEKRLSADLIQYLGAFTKTGRPSAPNSAAWPAYNEGAQILALMVGGASKVKSDLEIAEAHNCAFWDKIGLQSE